MFDRPWFTSTVAGPVVVRRRTRLVSIEALAATPPMDKCHTHWVPNHGSYRCSTHHRWCDCCAGCQEASR